MAEVTNELLPRVWKSIRRRPLAGRSRLDQVRPLVSAARRHLARARQDVNHISSMLIRTDSRLDRIERRLELADAH